MKHGRQRLVSLALQLQRYADHNCKKRKRLGAFVRQVMIPLLTYAEYNKAAAIHEGDYVTVSRVWIDISKLRAAQECLSVRQLVYQLRRFPISARPTVIRLPGTRHYALWDGHHRATTAILLGRTRLLCDEIKRKPKAK